jgi:GT2 family glycosyltransferase
MRFVAIVPSTCSDNILPLLLECINSLRKASKGVLDLKIIIVCNRPSNSAIFTKIKHNDLYLAKENAGFAEMNNIAIEKAYNKYKPNYFLLINDDARINNNFFTEFSRTVHNRNVDIIIPLVKNSKGNAIDSFGLEYFSSGFAKTSNNLTAPTHIPSGSCFIIKTSLLRKLKSTFGYYFNETFHFYFEDVELGIRAKILNANTFKSGGMIAYHTGSASSNDRSYFKYFYSYRNLIWTVLITWPTLLIIKNIVKIITFQIIAFIILTYNFGLTIYPKIILDTYQNFNILVKQRNRLLKSYKKGFDIDLLLNKHMLKTKNGTYI